MKCHTDAWSGQLERSLSGNVLSCHRGRREVLCGQFGLLCLSLVSFLFLYSIMTHRNWCCFTRITCLFCLNVCLWGLTDTVSPFPCVFNLISWRHHYEYIVFVHLKTGRIVSSTLIYYCNIFCVPFPECVSVVFTVTVTQNWSLSCNL